MPENRSFRALRGKVIVKRHESGTMSSGGLHIPENARREPNMGTVVAVGRGRILDNGVELEPQVNVGDEVAFAYFAGMTQKIDGIDFEVMWETEVLAIIVPD